VHNLFISNFSYVFGPPSDHSYLIMPAAINKFAKNLWANSKFSESDGYTKQVPYSGLTNRRRHRTKCNRPRDLAPGTYAPMYATYVVSSFGISLKNIVCIYNSSHACYMFRPFHPPQYNDPKISVEYKLWSPAMWNRLLSTLLLLSLIKENVWRPGLLRTFEFIWHKKLKGSIMIISSVNNLGNWQRP
jgi:hypothetical protein